MAAELRHAAGQPVYEVHELQEGDPVLDLGVRFQTSDYGAAVEFAFDLLQRRDPRREGAVSALEIVRVEDGRRETVWSYSHSRTLTSRNDLVGMWGFDVTRPWHHPSRPTPRPRTYRH
jgi:hypothetical protein